MLRNVSDLKAHGLVMQSLLCCLSSETFYVVLVTVFFKWEHNLSSTCDTITWELHC